MTDRPQSTPFYDTPTVPPATPPVINEHANPADAGLAKTNGDSDYPGSTPDETVEPGGDTYDPSIPEQGVPPGEESIDQPGETPDEIPAAPAIPAEAPAPD
ncbi:MAG: hypothetical protein J7496_04480 [Novosphingobium sp.]|nr:hypothetical protein [Novosphingobium sp.]